MWGGGRGRREVKKRSKEEPLLHTADTQAENWKQKKKKGRFPPPFVFAKREGKERGRGKLWGREE